MRCVVVEDTAIGATAGKAANMKAGIQKWSWIIMDQ
jgi:beta-phosphoglucomutase-like phosphatase (HAD superfamily)